MKRSRSSPLRNTNLIGLVLCVLVFALGFALLGNVSLYFNFAGLAIVLGGTMGAVLLSYRVERLRIVGKVLRSSYLSEPKSPEEIVEILVDLSVKRRFQGLLSLQEDEEETVDDQGPHDQLPPGDRDVQHADILADRGERNLFPVPASLA